MDKILSLNTIKNVFSALGAKTSDSNYAVALLDKTSAEPKGMMDFANLASVLGGTLTELSANTDLDNLTKIGNYMANFSVGPTVINQPAGIAGAFVIYVEIGYAVGKCCQRLIDWEGVMYVRFQRSSNFISWRRCDNI